MLEQAVDQPVAPCAAAGWRSAARSTAGTPACIIADWACEDDESTFTSAVKAALPVQRCVPPHVCHVLTSATTTACTVPTRWPDRHHHRRPRAPGGAAGLGSGCSQAVAEAPDPADERSGEEADAAARAVGQQTAACLTARGAAGVRVPAQDGISRRLAAKVPHDQSVPIQRHRITQRGEAAFRMGPLDALSAGYTIPHPGLTASFAPRALHH